MDAITNAPVILELGKASRKNVKELREGRGKLLDDVHDALQEVVSSLGEKAEGKQLVPVVLLYRKKAKKRRRGGLFPVVF